MDIQHEIRSKVADINKLSNNKALLEGIDAVITHLERAEKYYKMGKAKSDENFFADVIYRTNQAFEGIIKDAYCVFQSVSEKDLRHVNLNEIEEFFSTNEGVVGQVRKMFAHYRE